MVILGDVGRGRDNNLNLVRILAAMAVLVSHAWPIDRGPGTPEPLIQLTGHSLGTLGVYVFFVISGFLITASFLRGGGVLSFLAARAARLFPGLIVSLLLVAFGLGPLVTTLGIGDYLSHPHTWHFLWANTTLVFPQYTLPGVFETNPFPAVEGSLWTLIHEVTCYLMVLGAGVVGLLAGVKRFAVFLALYALIWAVVLALPAHVPQRVMMFLSLSLPFVLGMAGWIWRDRIGLSLWGVAGLAGLWLVLRQTPVAFPALILLIGYGVAWAAYVPGGAIRRYNRLGDYSYGVYIYAFPLQGLVAWMAGQVGPALHCLLAIPPVLAISILSWHLIEKPALDLRHMVSGKSRAGRIRPTIPS